mmetsp:Transcript_9870/g.14531  ORF Transcript_9870/g.14531 Transcript_9870/m.14531 type:complete len:423 (+) Transcript_9870:203-1471(+)
MTYFVVLLLCFAAVAKSFHNNHNPRLIVTPNKEPTAALFSTTFEEEAQQHQHDQQKEQEDKEEKSIVSLLLWISYDGGRFTGWSSTKQEKENQPVRGKQKKQKDGFVRSVQFAIQHRLARVYGDIDVDQIVVEGTSRTDKGVHAQMAVAQIYGLTSNWKDYYNDSNNVLSIPGKKLPHPNGAYDSNRNVFLPLPKDPSNLVFVLNKVLPHDISVRGYQLPTFLEDNSSCDTPFHPSHDAVRKTYNYTFSLGPIHDPTLWRNTWYIRNYPQERWNVSLVEEACQFLEGDNEHTCFDFRAFRGAPRGKDDQIRFAKQSTLCSLHRVFIEQSDHDNGTMNCPIPGITSYCLSFTGDRFLYKMVRFLVGALVDVGRGKLSLEAFKTAVMHQSFPEGYQKSECAPAHGLSLVEIDFGDKLDKESWKT